MKYRVRLTEKAEADVAGVLEWFRDQQALTAGGKWYAALTKAVDTLGVHPERCGLAVEADALGQDVRELLIGKRRGVYRLLFIVSGKAVDILRVAWRAERSDARRSVVIGPVVELCSAFLCRGCWCRYTTGRCDARDG